jgi:hypothetical protein
MHHVLEQVVVEPYALIKGVSCCDLLNRNLFEHEVQELIHGAAYLLHFSHPYMTPRILDNAIWMYERSR